MRREEETRIRRRRGPRPSSPLTRRAPGPLALALALSAALMASSSTWPLAARAQSVDPDPNTLPKGDGPLYASAAQIYSAMDRWAAANPRYFSVYRAKDPAAPDDNSFPVGRFTDTRAPPGNKKRVLITCAVHARELIVPEVCLNLLRLLAGTPADKRPVLAWSETTAALKRAGIAVRTGSPISGGSTTSSARDPLTSFISSFAQNYDLHVAPLINLSGRMLIEQSGKFSQRKTANGVDINRNFYYGWSDSNKDVNSETYPGPYPASQWETRAMVALMTSVNPHAYADMHSGVAAYLTPLGTTCSQLDVAASGLPPLQDAADRMLRVVGNITNGPSAALLYTSPGTGGDHAYGGQGISSSVTYEVFGGFSGSPGGRGVLCPRYQTWNDKCRLPASADDPATGCSTECGSDPTLRCKNILGTRGSRVGTAAAAAATDEASASSASSSSSSSSALAWRSAFVQAARRAGLTPAATRWQAALAEAAAEDPGILVPDGELFWTEFERERERERQQAGGGSGGGGGGDGNGGRATGAASEPLPAYLRHLPPGKELDAALAKRRALRVALTDELRRIVGGGGAGGSGGASAAAAVTPAAADPALPAWYALDPCLRNYVNATSSERSYFTMFNPIQPAQYRKVVADYSVSLLLYASAASRGPLVAGR